MPVESHAVASLARAGFSGGGNTRPLRSVALVSLPPIKRTRAFFHEFLGSHPLLVVVAQDRSTIVKVWLLSRS